MTKSPEQARTSEQARTPAATRIILGLWPIAGVTTVGVTREAARQTIRAAIDAGVDCFDTAYSYGYDGESDRLIGEFLLRNRERFRLIGKVGQRWTKDRQRVVDGRPERLIRDAEHSLQRLGTPYFDLLMLHGPDPEVPLEASAEAIERLRRRGLCRQIGICNAEVEQRRAFAAAAECAAIQCPLNMLQQGSLKRVIPDAADDGCDVHVYWTLMKGLLAGKISRDHRFDPADSRPRYAIYQGEQRQRAHDLLDRLQSLGNECGQTVAQLAIGWTLSQPGVTAALVGARRTEQIQETAASRPLEPDVRKQVDQLIEAATTPRSP